LSFLQAAWVERHHQDLSWVYYAGHQTGTPVRPGQEFRYVWHCHVLEHEDNEMIRPYLVIG